MDDSRRSDPARRNETEAAVHELLREELPAAVAVIARGMRDNPLHVAAYGTDPDRRLRCHARLIRALLAASPALRVLGATQQGSLVAVAAEAPSGTCRPTPRQLLRMGPRVAYLGPGSALRVRAWTRAWAEHDPTEPHVHLGPVAVDAHLQGRGLGSIIMREHCRRLDETQQMGYLETDKPVNVRFYHRFGYHVVGQTEVLGVSNWFMRRPPRASSR